MFNPLMENAVLALKLKGSVCELGNQRYGGNNRWPSVEAFYLGNGFSSYLALDVNTGLSAVIADLNYPIDMGQFDLVTNNGTSEHVFNQFQVFENIHNLCKVGGVMLHVLPCSPYLNHGFFNYNPILFRDLAKVNGYEIRLAQIGNRDGKVVELGEWGFREKRANELADRVKKLGPTLCVFALKRMTDASFRMPIQQKYEKDIRSDELAARYT